jgi:pimeloyl-ACP methyl ester carboxylesterase
VLLFHHGTPGSGTPFRAIDAAAHRLGLRLVTTSRAGYGDSTRLPGRSVVNVVEDSAAVLDAIGAEHCYVAGWSGGGPHALACGARLASRVRAVLVIAGVAPYEILGSAFTAGMGESNVTEFGKAVAGEMVVRPSIEAERAQLLQATPSALVQTMSSILPPVDQEALSGDIGDDLVTNAHEALRRGLDGWLDDDLAFVAPWGFALTEVAVPATIWQGGQDLMVPAAHGKVLADLVPGAVFHFEPGDGHISLTAGSIERMLQELVAIP